jgi:hypothetical protein
MHSAMDGVLDLAQSIVLVHSPAIDVALGASATLKGPFDPISRKAIYYEFTFQIARSTGGGTRHIHRVRTRETRNFLIRKPLVPQRIECSRGGATGRLCWPVSRCPAR